MYVRAPRVSVTGSLPTGFMVVPLTARGVMVDGRRLAGCSLSWWSKVVPPTQMSAPESGRASTMACPFSDDIWILIVGAGSKLRERSFEEASRGVAETVCAPGGGGSDGVGVGEGDRLPVGSRCPPRHTLA